jgi:hypothetical protein
MAITVLAARIGLGHAPSVVFHLDVSPDQEILPFPGAPQLAEVHRPPSAGRTEDDRRDVGSRSEESSIITGFISWEGVPILNVQAEHLQSGYAQGGSSGRPLG